MNSLSDNTLPAPPGEWSARKFHTIVWTVAVTVGFELVTIYLRFQTGISATQFSETAPLLFQMHHMFWSLPLFVVLPFAWRKPKLSGAILGSAFGLILSDLAHHFIVLPLTVGNTGWHWP